MYKREDGENPEDDEMISWDESGGESESLLYLGEPRVWLVSGSGIHSIGCFVCIVCHGQPSMLEGEVHTLPVSLSTVVGCSERVRDNLVNVSASVNVAVMTMTGQNVIPTTARQTYVNGGISSTPSALLARNSVSGRI